MSEKNVRTRSKSSEKIVAICHPERKHQAFGMCDLCYAKHYREKNPEKMREIGKRRHERDKNIPERKHKKYLQFIKRLYNLTEEEFNLLFSKQNGCCKICELPPNKNKRLHVDHCHKTGKVRGLLCAQCNWFIGKIDKNFEIINKLQEYYEK